MRSGLKPTGKIAGLGRLEKVDRAPLRRRVRATARRPAIARQSGGRTRLPSLRRATRYELSRRRSRARLCRAARGGHRRQRALFAGSFTPLLSRTLQDAAGTMSTRRGGLPDYFIVAVICCD